MPTPFSRSIRSLGSDRFSLLLAVLLTAVVLLTVWGAWLLLDRVSVFVGSEAARLEVRQESHPIQAVVAGRLVAVHATLGEEVEAGDLLFELDGEQASRLVEEEGATLTAARARLESLDRELSAARDSLEDFRQASRAALEQATAQLGEAQARARLAGEEAERIGRLYDKGLVSEVESLRARSQEDQARSAAAGRQLALESLRSEQLSQRREREAHLDRLAGERSDLLGRIETSRAKRKRFQHDLERRRIRAPISGRVGDLAQIQIGRFVDEGDRLGSVVPRGELRIVARFRAGQGMGRIREGQRARFLLDGFSWLSYGSIPATVDRVSSETRDGLFRVELSLDEDRETPIPLTHGLPGLVEVEVEQVSPATLLLRNAGAKMRSAG